MISSKNEMGAETLRYLCVLVRSASEWTEIVDKSPLGEQSKSRLFAGRARCAWALGKGGFAATKAPTKPEPDDLTHMFDSDEKRLLEDAW